MKKIVFMMLCVFPFNFYASYSEKIERKKFYIESLPSRDVMFGNREQKLIYSININEKKSSDFGLFLVLVSYTGEWQCSDQQDFWLIGRQVVPDNNYENMKFVDKYSFEKEQEAIDYIVIQMGKE